MEEKIATRWPPWVFFVGIGAALMVATAAAYGSKVLAPAIAVVEPPPLLLPELDEAAEVPVAPAPEPVRIRNPFDKEEVFEFPAGTSKQAAHDAVAEMLLARARERGAG